MIERSSRVVLIAVIGLFLVTSGVMKAAALGSDEFTKTLVWSAAGERAWLVLGLAAFETLIGVLLWTRLWPRLVSRTIVLLLVAMSLVVVREQIESGATKPCGCLGVLDRAGVTDWAWVLGRNLVLALGVLFTATRCGGVRRPGSVIEGGSDRMRA